MALTQRIVRNVRSPKEGYDLVAPYYESWHWFAFWQDYEASFVRQWLSRLKPGSGLDVGSGTGPYLENILENGHRCVALDISPNMLQISRTKHFTGKMEVAFVEEILMALPFPAEYFDWILCTRVLSHVSELNEAIGEMDRVLKPGGEIFISDIHPLHPYIDTSIPTPAGKIHIHTFKHEIASVKSASSKAGDLQLLELKEFRLKDLNPPPDLGKFGKLFRNQRREIFYFMVLEKGKKPVLCDP